MPRALCTTVLALLVASTLSACGASTASLTPVATGIAAPSASVEPSASAPAGIDLSNIPTACISLGVDECRRVVAEMGHLVPAGTATYVQVGPFGCPAVEGCARSLAARPQGDVTIEAANGVLSYHVTSEAGGNLTIERQDAFLTSLPPESQPPVTPGVRPFTLGHCGLWSGIDVGGSWWDPVGPIDGDHPSAINSADGTLAILDSDRATFTSNTGFTVHLVRREGPKSFPGCA